MWESKEQAIDLSYNADELWFKGVYGQSVNKPLEIRKWEENTKFFKLLDKTYPRSKADRILTDLSLIALTYSNQAVQQRLTFKPNSKGQNSAPVVFQLVLELRSAQPAPPAEEPKPHKDNSLVADDDFDEAGISKTFFIEPKAERMLRQQKEMIEECITGSDDPGDDKYEPFRAAASDRHALELYSQLTNDEFLYVQELQRVYDESRCFFVQWVICKETKELVKSARISALHQGREFTWVDTRLEILKSLTDVTLTARFLALSRLKRQNGSTAKLWLSQVMTRRAMLEDPKLLAPVRLPETLYLEITVGQLSAQETTVFDCPCIGDDLLDKKDRAGNYVWTLEKLKRVVDQGSTPPAFRGVKTPITELLEHDPAKTPNKHTPRDKGSAPPEHKRKLNARAAEKDSHPDKHGTRPPHERPAIFPKGLKRPDLNATFEGQAVASEFQQKLYDDIAHGNCIRCHSKSHARSTCKEPVGRWETKFDTEKEKY
jgi:hypothetical protein